MSRTQDLRHNVINQMIDGIAKGHITSPLPSQASLAEMYSISRTTVRNTLSHLHQCGVLEKVGDYYIIVRTPRVEDGFDCVSQSSDAQAEIFEHAFFQMINQRQLRAGDSFQSYNWPVPRMSALSLSGNFYCVFVAITSL